jgi:hypothetical protein
MSAPAVAPSQNLIDGVDVDAVARAVLGCPGVEDLHGGFHGEVATYLPERRVFGVRVGSRAVEVHVRTAWGMPVRQIAVGIQAAVAPLAGGRAVDVTIADLGDPPGTGRTNAVGQPSTSGQAVAKHPGRTPAGETQADSLSDTLRDPGSDRGFELVDHRRQVDRPAPPGQSARADRPTQEGSDRS